MGGWTVGGGTVGGGTVGGGTVGGGTVGGGTVGGGWGHSQGDMHMVAAGLSCQSAMVRTVWANSCPGCMDRL